MPESFSSLLMPKWQLFCKKYPVQRQLSHLGTKQGRIVTYLWICQHSSDGFLSFTFQQLSLSHSTVCHLQVKGFTQMKGSGLAQGHSHTLTKRPLIIRDFHISLIWEPFRIDARRKKNKENSIWKFPQWLNNTVEMAFARLNRHAPLDPKHCSETNSWNIVQSLTGAGIPTIKPWSNSSNSSGASCRGS